MLNNQSTDGTKAGLNRNTDLDFLNFRGSCFSDVNGPPGTARIKKKVAVTISHNDRNI